MRSFLAYTAARLLLFAVTFGVLYLLGARGLLAAALAVLISGLVSYVLLARQRDAVSSVVAGRLGRLRGVSTRLEAGAAKEDSAQRGGATAESAARPDNAQDEPQSPERAEGEATGTDDEEPSAKRREPAADTGRADGDEPDSRPTTARQETG